MLASPIRRAQQSMLMMAALFFVVTLLSGCLSEKPGEALDGINSLHESASGAYSTAKMGVETVVDTGIMLKEGADAFADDVVSRVKKVKDGVGLVKEGLTSD